MENNHVFKVTCFAPIEPSQLANVLGIYFKTVKTGFEMNMDGTFFRIEPFQNQPRTSMKGYRIYFDCDIHAGLYLLDQTIGHMEPIVTGVECILSIANQTTQDWIRNIKMRSYKSTGRGLFDKEGVGIIVVNNTVTLQIRSRKDQKLKVVECINKIDSIRKDLLPAVEYDLFSLPENESIA